MPALLLNEAPRPIIDDLTAQKYFDDFDAAPPEEQRRMGFELNRYADEVERKEAEVQYTNLERIFTDRSYFEERTKEFGFHEGALASISPESVNIRAANQAFLAYFLNKTPSEIDDVSYEAWRNEWAKKYHGRENVNDLEFFGLAGETFKTAGLVRQAAEGLMGYAVVNAFQDLASGETVSNAKRVQDYVSKNAEAFKGQNEVEVLRNYGRVYSNKQKRDLAKKIGDDLRENSQGKILNRSTNHEIDFSKNGLKHWTNYSGDFRKLALLERIEEVVANAVYIKTERPDARKAGDQNIRAYHKFALPISFSRKQAVAKISIQEDANGNWVYDGQIEDLIIKEPVDDSSRPASTEMDRLQDIQRAKMNLLQKLFGVNGTELTK